jgi:hypothetical protein
MELKKLSVTRWPQFSLFVLQRTDYCGEVPIYNDRTVVIPLGVFRVDKHMLEVTSVVTRQLIQGVPNFFTYIKCYG